MVAQAKVPTIWQETAFGGACLLVFGVVGIGYIHTYMHRDAQKVNTIQAMLLWCCNAMTSAQIQTTTLETMNVQRSQQGRCQHYTHTLMPVISVDLPLRPFEGGHDVRRGWNTPFAIQIRSFLPY